MDVELLRPGTVPANPDTVLWFEFLLDPNLLERHFNKVNPDPSPENLIIKFLSTSLEPPEDPELHTIDGNNADHTNDVNHTPVNGSSRRQSLKILAIKIGALWKFSLEEIESKLPICLQNTLLRELIAITSPSHDSNTLIDINLTSIPDEYMFSLSLFHRWVLKTLSNAIEFKQIRMNAVQGSLTENEELLSHLQSMSGRSEQFLKVLCTFNKPSGYIIVPTSQCFTALIEQNVDTHRHDFTLGFKLNFMEFLCQILFDLSAYQVYREDYIEAKSNIAHCKRIFDSLPEGPVSPYCTVTQGDIQGYCEAIGVDVDEKNTLELMLLDSINNDYRNVIGILQQDNLVNEIPMSARISLELDVAASLATGKFSAARDLLFQIQTLNAIRQAPVISDYATKLCASKKGIDILVWALAPVLKNATLETKTKLQLFLLKLLDQCDETTVQSLVKHKEVSTLLNREEVADILEKKNMDQSSVLESSSLMDALWITQNESGRNCDLVATERQLIASFNVEDIKQYIYTLCTNSNKCMWNLCFIQQYSFVILAKARELNDMQEYAGAQNLLQSLELELKKQTQNSVLEFKLQQLITWESLHFSINQLLDQWPAHSLDPKTLITRSQECLECLQSNDNHVIPRLEIIEACSLALLNLMEWQYLSTFPMVQRCIATQLCASLAVACIEMEKSKGNKKFSRDLWDLVVPIFAVNKRKHGNYGGPQPPVRESPISVLQMSQFLTKLREPTAIIVMATLFTRVYNILRDDQSMEVHIEWMNLWPSMLPGNAAMYTNARTVTSILEILSSLLTDALRYEPNNVNFLKLLADIFFVNKHFSSAMKYYILSIISITDYFSRRINRLVDNHVYRRMIKCCIYLQCYTQAAVLCQFLDEVDYTTAFKSLAEENFCADAMDSYYDCIWDMNILEYLVCLHHKRNEYVRKQQAINIIGLLELNANNNEEIKREAANKRKTKFLQALASQYVA
ncbi:hypothetical protein M8J76_003912 [Diaphorina citri]|nr:hypothetical protein M8J75_007672 [Diaphorina citri]KAI5740443.1 hypothetical protein M8J76_003912 [Diaphorina citri]